MADTQLGFLNPLNWFTAFGNILNNKEALRQGQENLQMQKEQMEYTKKLNEEIMRREDTAYQRKVNDLRKAGLSPLMIDGGGAGAGGTMTTYQAPQDTTDYNALGTNFNNAMASITSNKFMQQDLNIRKTSAD